MSKRAPHIIPVSEDKSKTRAQKSNAPRISNNIKGYRGRRDPNQIIHYDDDDNNSCGVDSSGYLMGSN